MEIARLETVRRWKKLSQEELAQRIGMTKNGYQRALKIGDMKASVLEKAADALGVDVTVFFRKDEITQDMLQEPNATYHSISQDLYNKLRKEKEVLTEKLIKCQEDLVQSLRK